MPQAGGLSRLLLLSYDFLLEGGRRRVVPRSVAPSAMAPPPAGASEDQASRAPTVEEYALIIGTVLFFLLEVDV